MGRRFKERDEMRDRGRLRGWENRLVGMKRKEERK